MALLSDFPLEILLQIFEDADTLHLKQVCHSFNELIDFAKAINGKYWSTSLKILESAIRKVELGVVPVNIVQLLPRSILADIIFYNEQILKKKEEERTKIFVSYVKANFSIPWSSRVFFFDETHSGMGMTGSDAIWHRRLHSYSIVHKQKTFELDTVEITDRMEVVCQLIKIGDIDTAMFMMKNYQNILDGSAKYIFCNKIATYCASVNNFDIYKKIIRLKDQCIDDIDDIVFINSDCYFTMYSHLEYFIQNQNLEAIQFIVGAETITELRIVELSVKICASTVFDAYFKHIDMYNEYNKDSIMNLINDSIRYNNLHAFQKILETTFIRSKLDSDVEVCIERTVFSRMKYYEAIELSAGCNKRFIDVFDNSSFMMTKKHKEKQLMSMVITFEQTIMPTSELKKKRKESIPITKNNLKVINKRRNQKPYVNKSQCQKSFHKKSHR